MTKFRTMGWKLLIALVIVGLVGCSLFERNTSNSPTAPGVEKSYNSGQGFFTYQSSSTPGITVTADLTKYNLQNTTLVVAADWRDGKNQPIATAQTQFTVNASGIGTAMLPVSLLDAAFAAARTNCQAGDCNSLWFAKPGLALNVFPVKAATTAQSQAAGPRIVGGTPAPYSNWPWIANLTVHTSEGDGRCGGTLIAPTWVVTAAHCVYDNGSITSNIDAKFGTADLSAAGDVIRVTQAIVHPGYNPATNDNDVALLQLSRASTQPPIPNWGATVPAIGMPVVVAGWGTTSEGGNISDLLLQVTVPVVSNTDCHNVYTAQGAGPITNNMFCAGAAAGGLDSCQGDSGGPILDQATGALVGVVSSGIGCALPGVPGIYTRLSNYVSWLTGYIGTTTPVTGTGIAPSGSGWNYGGSLSELVSQTKMGWWPGTDVPPQGTVGVTVNIGDPFTR